MQRVVVVGLLLLLLLLPLVHHLLFVRQPPVGGVVVLYSASKLGLLRSRPSLSVAPSPRIHPPVCSRLQLRKCRLRLYHQQLQQCSRLQLRKCRLRLYHQQLWKILRFDLRSRASKEVAEGNSWDNCVGRGLVTLLPPPVEYVFLRYSLSGTILYRIWFCCILQHSSISREFAEFFWTSMVLRWWLYTFVTSVELFVSTMVHMTYGLWIASSAVVLTLTGFISEEHRRSSSKVMPFLASALSPMSGTLVDLPEDGSEHHLHSAATAFMDADVKTPIVMLHGIFGFGKGKLGKFSYWGGAELKDDRVLVPDLGALTSIHDRACALFYYLKGGTVLYGATHAQEFGHSPFGRNYDEGHYPQWDEHHPIHFVGHSTGVQVARLLQQLLAEKRFPGHDTNENWVISITSLSGALNGTTRVHMDGINEDGRTMRPVCLLQILRIAVLIYEWIDFGILNRFYGFGFDHYNLSWRKAGLKGLISTLLGHSGPFTNTDWILPDLSIHSAIEFNKRVRTYPNTFYFSYASKITRKVFGFTVPSSLFRVHPLLLIRSIQMCLFRFTTPPYMAYRDEEWLDNDGALNTMSQLFPCIPTPHPNQEMESDELNVGQTFQPGIWYYRVIESDHINFIINKDRAGLHFDILYDSIFQRCRKHYQRPSSLKKLGSVCKCVGDCVCNHCGERKNGKY